MSDKHLNTFKIFQTFNVKYEGGEEGCYDSFSFSPHVLLATPGSKATYLLYMRRSGFQIYFGGILMSPMSPYSVLFQIKLMSVHS